MGDKCWCVDLLTANSCLQVCLKVWGTVAKPSCGSFAVRCHTQSDLINCHFVWAACPPLIKMLQISQQINTVTLPIP